MRLPIGILKPKMMEDGLFPTVDLHFDYVSEKWIRLPSPNFAKIVLSSPDVDLLKTQCPLTGATELNFASSSRTFPSRPSRAAAETTGQLLAFDQGNYFPSVQPENIVDGELAKHLWAESHNPEISTKVTSLVAWSELPDRVQDEIFGRLSMRNKICNFKAILCPPILRPHPSSEGEFNPLSFFNTDEAGDLRCGDFDTSSRDGTYFPSPNSFAGMYLPSPNPDLSKDFLVAGDVQSLLCINVGNAGGAEKLVIYNPTATGQMFEVLPPLFMHPVLMHLRVDDNGHYRVLVAGSTTIGTEDPSLITEEYSSTTGVWECTGNLPCPSFGLNEYQNGVYFTDSERELLLCVAILDMKLGTKGVLMYDFKKKQWVQGSIIPLVGSELPNVVSYITTTHIVGCGGSIFVSSKQECEQDVYSCIHKLNLESIGDDLWEEIIQEKWTDGLYLRAGLQIYPQFTCELPFSATAVRHKRIGVRPLLVDPEYTCVPWTYRLLLSATVVAESGFMFSEQEVGKDVFICIHKLKPPLDGFGDGVWEEIMRRKRKRHRAPNWTAGEINAYLKLKDAGLGVLVGKDWDYISEGLGERYGIIRGSQ